MTSIAVKDFMPALEIFYVNLFYFFQVLLDMIGIFFLCEELLLTNRTFSSIVFTVMLTDFFRLYVAGAIVFYVLSVCVLLQSDFFLTIVITLLTLSESGRGI